MIVDNSSPGLHEAPQRLAAVRGETYRCPCGKEAWVWIGLTTDGVWFPVNLKRAS